MKVTTEINLCSINGVDTSVGEVTKLKVSNVWNRTKLVELQIGDGQKVTVRESELKKAIDNAINNEP